MILAAIAIDTARQVLVDVRTVERTAGSRRGICCNARAKAFIVTISRSTTAKALSTGHRITAIATTGLVIIWSESGIPLSRI
jgi:hypothetical protein